MPEKFVLVGPLRPFQTLRTPDPQSGPGAPGPLSCWFFGLCDAGISALPSARVVSEACLCPLSAVSRDRLMSHVWPIARSEQLRQLAVQLASQASLVDVVTHGFNRPLDSSRQSHL